MILALWLIPQIVFQLYFWLCPEHRGEEEIKTYLTVTAVAFIPVINWIILIAYTCINISEAYNIDEFLKRKI